MWPFIPGERFPYSNFHAMNQDWIISVVKDFLNKYTNVEQLLNSTTAAGIVELTNKKNELETLLDTWYNTHSEDIANQLATALQDINSFVNEVISSIPQDYSDLSSRITALQDKQFTVRSLLKAEDVFSIYGKFIAAGGVISNSANHVATDFIRLNAGDTVEYNLAGSDNSVIVFCEYNTLKQFRNTIAVGNGSATAVTGTYTAPVDVYIRMCCRRDYAPTIKINNGPEFSTDTDKNIFENALYSKQILNINDILSLENNCIHATDGQLVPSTNYRYSDFIRCLPGDVINYSLRGSDNTIALIAMYNENKDWLKNIAVGIQYQTDVSGSYTIENGCYIRICNRKDNPSGYVYFNNGLTYGIKDYISSYIGYPEYWRNLVNQKINEYNNYNAIVGKNGLSFAFITDTHWSDNAQHSPEILNYICKHTNMDTVIHGGDHVITSLNDIRSFVNSIDKTTVFVPCIGNHEYDANLHFTNNEIWSCDFKRSEFIMVDNQGFNYSVDNEFQKTRIVVLDYTDNNAVQYMNARIAELPEGWKVIIICHMYWQKETPSSPIAVTSIGAAIASSLNNNYAIWAAKPIAYFTGHLHQDYSTVLTCGVPVICTNCDAYADAQSSGWGGYDMTRGTTTEQCFDLVNIDYTNKKIYMTRIGAGNNREFNIP